jgi:predicted ATP-grasp superfamily ATP-dependent carboligase
MIPAVVLSSHTIGLAVIRALGVMNVPVHVFYYDKNDMGFVSRYVRDKVHAPHPEKQEKQFISQLIDYAGKIGKSILFPADDATLKVVSKNKEALQRYYIVACPAWDVTEQFIDKKYTYALAERLGIPCPRTLVPESFEEMETFAKKADFPCLIKPCESHSYFELFRKKMVKAETPEQMLMAYKQATEAGFSVMLQEFIPGDDTHGVNYNSYFSQGRALVEFTAEKVRYAPPALGVPRVVISKEIPEIAEPGRKILAAMGFNGFSCTEFKRDPRNGVYKLMEVNGRHNRSGLLAVHCGINFPWIEYSHLAYGETPSERCFRQGVYWIDEVSDMINSVKYYKYERFALKEYVKPYSGPHVFAVFDAKDLKPIAKRMVDLAGMLFRQLRSPLNKRVSKGG